VLKIKIFLLCIPLFFGENILQNLIFLLKNPPPPPHADLDFGLVAFFGSSFFFIVHRLLLNPQENRSWDACCGCSQKIEKKKH
jgi:hypothetical protein